MLCGLEGLIVLVLLELHDPSGQPVELNPDGIVSMRGPRDGEEGKGNFVKGARCLINTTDGKYITVTEDCTTIRDMIKTLRGDE